MSAQFIVWCPKRGATREDGKLVKASDAERAVEVWAEWDDARSADYSIVSGTNLDVVVLDVREDREQTFIVSGRSEPVYTARLKAKGEQP